MVENYIIDHNVAGLQWHKEVLWTVNRKGNKGRGKVDLIDNKGGMYEIKPAASEIMGIRQLRNYMLGEAMDPSKLKVKEAIHIGRAVFCDSFISDDERYIVNF